MAKHDSIYGEDYSPHEPKQVYEWVKTGVWSRLQFETWVRAVVDAAYELGDLDAHEKINNG